MTSFNEWFEIKIKDDEINYIEYNEFSNVEKVGEGAFGIVKSADWKNCGIKIALKILVNNNPSINEDNMNEFVRELKNLKKVSFHPNINRCFGITKDLLSNKYVMVLEYANQGNLREYLKKKFDSLQWNDKIQMALDIICGLKCLHFKEIIHRDLHAKNILVNNNRLMIADFGSSKQLSEVSSSSIKSTADGIGMVEYIEPQCFKTINYKKDKKSDIYSLGVLLWEISSGHPPFPNFSRDPSGICALGIHISYESHREKPVEGTPLEYQQLYQKCWDGDPNSRPDINEVHKIILSQLKELESSGSQSSHEKYENSDLNNCDSQIYGLNIPDHIEEKCWSDDSNSCNGTSTSTSDLVKPNDLEEKEKEKIKTLLIVGRTGVGKSTLANVLSDTYDFEESESSVSNTRDFQEKEFEFNGTKYRVIEADQHQIREVINLSQVLYVVDGVFTKEMGIFIFENGIAEYTTIVRTKFSDFKNKAICEEDKEYLYKENKTIKLCSIIYVDNPPMDIIVSDEDDEERVKNNKKRRNQSRNILQDHLEKVCQEKIIRIKNVNDNYMKKTKSAKYLPNLKKLRHLKEFKNNTQE